MKITQKQLYGYYRANEGLGIGFNDNYNTAQYGITRELSGKIGNAIYSLTGSHNTRLSLRDINTELAGV